MTRIYSTKMKKIVLSVGTVILLIISGCSELGYETSYETDRRLCEKCVNDCNPIGANEAFNFLFECDNACQTENMKMDYEARFDYCKTWCQAKWDNRTDVKEYRECYYNKCDWIC